MNEVIQTILTRRSVRKYESRPVSREDLEQIVQCGQYAATGMGFQPWHFTVVTDRAVLDKLAKANADLMVDDPNTPPFLLDDIKNGTFDPYRGAPCAVLVSGENGEQNTIADCANAVENMAIAAKSLGLDSCYLASYRICFGGPNGDALKAELGIPEGYIPYFALSIGYGAEKPEAAPRREGTVNWL
jgi:nitroreductase